jgi:hypothetical protein
LSFPGYDIPQPHLEPLQLMKYGPGEQLSPHTDWFADSAQSHKRVSTGANRLSSFLAYVQVRNHITGGGARFPLLSPPSDARWCDWTLWIAKSRGRMGSCSGLCRGMRYIGRILPLKRGEGHRKDAARRAAPDEWREDRSEYMDSTSPGKRGGKGCVLLPRALIAIY